MTNAEKEQLYSQRFPEDLITVTSSLIVCIGAAAAGIASDNPAPHPPILVKKT